MIRTGAGPVPLPAVASDIHGDPRQRVAHRERHQLLNLERSVAFLVADLADRGLGALSARSAEAHHQPVGRDLRPDATDGAVEELERIVGQVRQRWPQVWVVVRGDSRCCREELMAWCEAQEGGPAGCRRGGARELSLD